MNLIKVDDSVDGSISFSVGKNCSFKYTITCTSDQIEISTVDVINPPISSEELGELSLEEINQLFIDAGFTDIDKKEITDLTVEEIDKVNIVSGITINGQADFAKEDSFFKDVTVVLEYHSLGDITMPMGKDYFDGMNYKVAESELRNLGFTIFEYETLETEKQEYVDTVSSVEIKTWEFGKGDFNKGDTYESDAIIVIWYYEYKEPEKSSPVFYSTNDYETAQEGNTGIFSYKNKGGSYDVYWIIDFDEGYVYFFTEGNEEPTCDKLRIESGNLNDKITITWGEEGAQVSWYLHFKYVNSPVTLVVNDHFGIATEFTTTDLYDALSVRDTKTIKEY